MGMRIFRRILPRGCGPLKNFGGFTRSASNFQRFEHYLSYRRAQASKSILIQVNAAESCPFVRDYLVGEYGPLCSITHYSVTAKGKGPALSPFPPKSGHFHWILAEFEREEDFVKAVSSSSPSTGSVPYTSAMTWFNPGPGKKVKGMSNVKVISSQQDEIEIPSENLNAPSSIDFAKGSSLNAQLGTLEEGLKLSDLGVRLRFFVSAQLESSLSSIFPQGLVLPFGSTVSGIGRQSGDLDLVILPDKKEVFPSSSQQSIEENQSSLGLMLQSKMLTSGNGSNARFQVQRVMETIADILQLAVPGCSHVQRILQARVPILRFWSDYTELQCDLSMTNSSGVHMSEIIFIMTKLDARFSTLLFAIRSWAAARKITNPVPGRQPTNFMFVLLLIHFLQQKKILPTLDVLFNNPENIDQRITADGIDCSFLRQTDKIQKHFSPQCSSESTSELLFQFFEFYSEFDFGSKGVCLLTGGSWGKPDAGPMYIQNPLERHLNVSRNVSKEEVSRFKSECCSALWKLETERARSSSKVVISLKDLLLTPSFENMRRGQEQGIKVKELFTE